jgi:hypothetical protein
MCIVIDINALSMVFNESNLQHKEFVFVKTWIEKGLGFIVYGGTKYKSELAATFKYMRLLRQMRDAGQAISICDSAVDKIEGEVIKLTDDTDCDDQHVIALLAAARCSLLCSVDTRSFVFVKDRNLYPKGTPKVKIYTSKRNHALLKRADPALLMNVE